jgi:hypothetical protein
MPSTQTVQPEDDVATPEESLEPTLQFCVLCDVVAQGPGDKPAFIGVFDQFRRLGPIPQFFVALRWIDGLGSHSSSIRLLDPDLNLFFEPPEKHPMTFKQRTDVATARYGIVNLQFPRPGVYWVEVLLNEQSYISVPLPVFDS